MDCVRFFPLVYLFVRRSGSMTIDRLRRVRVVVVPGMFEYCKQWSPRGSATVRSPGSQVSILRAQELSPLRTRMVQVRSCRMVGSEGGLNRSWSENGVRESCPWRDGQKIRSIRSESNRLILKYERTVNTVHSLYECLKIASHLKVEAMKYKWLILRFVFEISQRQIIFGFDWYWNFDLRGYRRLRLRWC